MHVRAAPGRVFCLRHRGDNRASIYARRAPRKNRSSKDLCYKTRASENVRTSVRIGSYAGRRNLCKLACKERIVGEFQNKLIEFVAREVGLLFAQCRERQQQL